MIYERVIRPEIARKINHMLDKIPQGIRQIVEFKYGAKIYICTRNYRGSFFTGEDYDIESRLDDPDLLTLAHFSSPERAIFMYDFNIEEVERNQILAYDPFLHEYGHALDFALGEISCHELYEYCHQRGLDWYGNLNVYECFAEAFATYFLKPPENYKPRHWFEHLPTGLKRQNPVLYTFFKSLEERNA